MIIKRNQGYLGHFFGFANRFFNLTMPHKRMPWCCLTRRNKKLSHWQRRKHKKHQLKRMKRIQAMWESFQKPEKKSAKQKATTDHKMFLRMKHQMPHYLMEYKIFNTGKFNAYEMFERKIATKTRILANLAKDQNVLVHRMSFLRSKVFISGTNKYIIQMKKLLGLKFSLYRTLQDSLESQKMLKKRLGEKRHYLAKFLKPLADYYYKSNVAIMTTVPVYYRDVEKLAFREKQVTEPKNQGRIDLFNAIRLLHSRHINMEKKQEDLSSYTKLRRFFSISLGKIQDHLNFAKNVYLEILRDAHDGLDSTMQLTARYEIFLDRKKKLLEALKRRRDNMARRIKNVKIDIHYMMAKHWPRDDADLWETPYDVDYELNPPLEHFENLYHPQISIYKDMEKEFYAGYIRVATETYWDNASINQEEWINYFTRRKDQFRDAIEYLTVAMFPAVVGGYLLKFYEYLVNTTNYQFQQLDARENALHNDEKLKTLRQLHESELKRPFLLKLLWHLYIFGFDDKFFYTFRINGKHNAGKLGFQHKVVAGNKHLRLIDEYKYFKMNFIINQCLTPPHIRAEIKRMCDVRALKNAVKYIKRRGIPTRYTPLQIEQMGDNFLDPFQSLCPLCSKSNRMRISRLNKLSYDMELSNKEICQTAQDFCFLRTGNKLLHDYEHCPQPQATILFKLKILAERRTPDSK